MCTCECRKAAHPVAVVKVVIPEDGGVAGVGEQISIAQVHMRVREGPVLLCTTCTPSKDHIAPFRKKSYTVSSKSLFMLLAAACMPPPTHCRIAPLKDGVGGSHCELSWDMTGKGARTGVVVVNESD